MTNIVEPAPALAAWANAMRLASEGQRDAALAEFKRAQRLDPEDPEYALRLAEAEGRALEVATLEEFGVRFPEHLTLWVSLGERCEQDGNLSRAAECFRRVLRLDLANVRAAEGIARLRRLGVQ